MNASDNAPSSDAERLSQALRDIVDEDRDREDSDGTADPVRMALSLVSKLGVDFVRRYNRLDIDGTADPAIEGPVLFVANHGFGGLFDLNILAIFAALTELGVEQDVVMLTHQSAWTLKVGKYIEPLGARPASRESAEAAFAAGADLAPSAWAEAIGLPTATVKASRAAAQNWARQLGMMKLQDRILEPACRVERSA